MLHITSGETLFEKLFGLGGEVLAWRDPLDEGPVPAGLSLAELSDLRAEYIAEERQIPLGEVQRQFWLRDEWLENARNEDEIVLWFRDTVREELQLRQILDWCAAQAGLKVTLVRAHVWEGPLEELFRMRRPAEEADYDLARRSWAAFRSPDPSELLSIARLEIPVLLDFLREYPSVENGLGWSEKRALEAVAAGSPGEWMGTRWLAGLQSGERPLVRREPVQLTEDGRAVLGGRANWLDLHPLYRWMGGVLLEPGAPLWRWRESALTLERQP
jgi:hypothetical protein